MNDVEDFLEPTQTTHMIVMDGNEVEYGFLKWYCEQFGFELAGMKEGLIFLRRGTICR